MSHHEVFVNKPLLYIADFRRCLEAQPTPPARFLAPMAFNTICRLSEVIEVPSFDDAVVSTPEEVLAQEYIRAFAREKPRSGQDTFALDHASFNHGIKDWSRETKSGITPKTLALMHRAREFYGPPEAAQW